MPREYTYLWYDYDNLVFPACSLGQLSLVMVVMAMTVDFKEKSDYPEAHIMSCLPLYLQCLELCLGQRRPIHVFAELTRSFNIWYGLL